MLLCEDCLTGSAYFTYICVCLIPWRRFWICTRSCWLSNNTILVFLLSLKDTLTISVVISCNILYVILSFAIISACSCLKNVISVPVSLPNDGSVACYHTMLFYLFWSGFKNILTLPVSLSLHLSVASCCPVPCIKNHTYVTRNKGSYILW